MSRKISAVVGRRVGVINVEVAEVWEGGELVTLCWGWLDRGGFDLRVLE